jgi:HSP20 family molecular chaperone IbpA
MARYFPFTFREFERTFDDLFDTLLIERWHSVSPHVGVAPNAAALDLGDRYEVRMGVGEADVSQIDIEVTDRHLRVRVPGETCSVQESSFSFSEPVDREAVKARLSEKVLEVVLPKRSRTKRIRVDGP